MKEYIVSLKIYFETPLSVNAKNESEAIAKAKVNFKKIFNGFSKKLDDIAELDISVDYVECQDLND